ncbi:MAG: hypothetical protein ACREAY_00205 [Nitrososphaera sp.]|uniref:hypothetical protein n=1 Tax=Nitrososphaera sp. TaxID=1971748 RepID=UPI003D6F6219
MLFIGHLSNNHTHKLASKKGIVITAAIVAGIIAASAMIWAIPQGNTTAANITDDDFSSEEIANHPADNLSFVYTEHNFIVTELESNFENWLDDVIDSEQMQDGIIDASARAQELRSRLVQPPQEWQASYSLYEQALDKFDEYLQEMETLVDSEEREPSPELEDIKAEMDSLIEQSIDSFPT